MTSFVICLFLKKSRGRYKYSTSMTYMITYHVSCNGMKRIYGRLIIHSKEHLIPLNITYLPMRYPSTMSGTNIIVLYLIRNYILFIYECHGKTGSTDTKIGGGLF